MSVWALADLHLSFGVPDKKMDVFGERWIDHPTKIREHWMELVGPEDLVLIPGDISWAIHANEVRPDLEWIASLPGTKVLLKGNHDYWWTSLKQVQQLLPPSLHVIQNNSFTWNDIAIGGTRLWDTPELSNAYESYIEYIPNPRAHLEEEKAENPAEEERIFNRELGRLEMSLKSMSKHAKTRIVMVHYPPVGPHLEPTRASALLEKYKIDICVFGHVHSIKDNLLPLGTKNGVRYIFTACDYCHCTPVQLI